jgi:hypothetical protein
VVHSFKGGVVLHKGPRFVRQRNPQDVGNAKLLMLKGMRKDPI